MHDRRTTGAPACLNLREMLDWAVTQSPVHVALLDTDLRQVRLNEALWREFGLPDEAAGLGLRLTDLEPGAGSEGFMQCGRQVIETGQPDTCRGFRATEAGLVRAWEATLSPIRDQAGQVIGVLLVASDVTEQYQARERLALLNEASVGIGSTLDVATTAEELVGVAVPWLADFVMIDILDSVLRGDEPVPGPVTGTVPLRRVACGSVLEGAPETVARPGQISSFVENSPMASCLGTGRSTSYSDSVDGLARWTSADPARIASTVAYGFHSMMMVPVRARGITLGLATFARHQRAEPFQDDDLVLAEEIVARAAVCIDNARRYTREHATALALQHSLLQRRQPDLQAVEVATRYLPAQSGVAVGGDWFDVFRLSGSRVGLVVGDVVGHGVHAAATMGRLRTAVRTLADIDLEPEELLTRLDDVVTRLAAEEDLPADGAAADLSATCLYAVYDPVSRICSLARAGHPVPAVVGPDGTAEFIDLPAGPPLGLGGLPFEEIEVQLLEGSLLVLYTDGLIESRQRDIDTGLNAMRKVLSEVHLQPQGPPHAAPALDVICDCLVDALLPERAGDDAALLVARTRGLAAGRIVSWDLPPEPAVVAEARARTVRQLAGWGLDELAFTTELLVSELVTNAIRHAQPPIQLRLILDGVLSCEVSDGASTAPHLRRADRYDEGGRGLMLIAQLAERWGTRHTRTGKTIWAQQPLPRSLSR